MNPIIGANITVMVADLDRSINFYTNVLGMKLKNRFGDHWADIEAPGLSIGLHPTKQRISPSNNLQIGLRVENLEESMALLKESGLQFSQGDDQNVRLAGFKDPDGNSLFLVQTE